MYLPLSFVNNDNRYSVNRGYFKTAIKTMRTVLLYKRKNNEELICLKLKLNMESWLSYLLWIALIFNLAQSLYINTGFGLRTVLENGGMYFKKYLFPVKPDD